MDWEEAIRQVRFLQNPFFPNARTCEVLDSDVDLFTANVQVPFTFSGNRSKSKS